MPSVVGLLEQREEADRIQAEWAAAERGWTEWVLARSRVGEVLAPADEMGQDAARADGPCRPPGSGPRSRRR